MDPEQVQNLATIAFTLEALSEKEGCTTRSTDLDGKPLEEFLIAGIDSGKYFRRAAENSEQIFHYLGPALRESQQYRSSKVINLGLLEASFAAAYARMRDDDPSSVIDTIITSLHQRSPGDVAALIQARDFAWRTSTKPAKRFALLHCAGATSPMEFYRQLLRHADEGDANAQWARQFTDGLPLLRTFYGELSAASPRGIMQEIATTHNRLRKEQPEMRVGILADMSAAAIFLRLSYR